MKILLTLLLAFPIAAMALDLDSARKQGLVKELPNGYIEATNPSAKSLVKEINDKRRAHYEKIAQENKLTVEVVGQQAAQKIQEKLSAK